MRAFHKRILLVFGWLAFSAAVAQAGTAVAKFEAILIWGTNGSAPTNSALSSVEPEVLRKLKTLPFKWSQYYEVHRETFEVDQGKQRKVTMSKDCVIVVGAADSETVEVELHGKGKRVGQITQKLPKRELLVVGGDAEDTTSWFVVLRRVE